MTCGKVYAPWIDPCHLEPGHKELHNFLDREATEAFKEQIALLDERGRKSWEGINPVSSISADDAMCDGLAVLRAAGEKPSR